MIRISYVLNCDLKILRLLTVALVLVGFASTEAPACPGTYAESTIIFDDIPTSLDAPVMVEVTINDMSRITDPSGMVLAVMHARIDKVIRGGPINDKILKIITTVTSCTKGFGAGSHGIVAGTLRSDAQGTVELVAIQESGIQREIRSSREQRK
jgi:hypothetical protein